MTSDLFDRVIHPNHVPANYYADVRQHEDATLCGFEQDFGDAVYPHVMADQLGFLNPDWVQVDPNWESLTCAEILLRLKRLDGYWQGCGFKPLQGLATYTPSNSLIQAMKELGWNVLHSIIPEQNWSDGRWSINHFGMPNQPFYVADDDFRKPTRRGDRNVVAMGMNSYHLYMPHVVHWGDNVLSPSHFLRWHRTVESGPEPLRFQEFFEDMLHAGGPNPEPVFLIAGFEFGRNFGVRSMTRHNEKGLQILLDKAKSHRILFSTGHDVAA